jgi:hypothetical protein
MADTDKNREEGVAFEVPEGVEVPPGVPTGDQHPRTDRAQGMQTAGSGKREEEGAVAGGQKMEAALYEAKDRQLGTSLGDTAAALGAGDAIHRETRLAEAGHMPYEEQLKGGVWVGKDSESGGRDVERVGHAEVTDTEERGSGVEGRDLPSTPEATENIVESTEGSS